MEVTGAPDGVKWIKTSQVLLRSPQGVPLLTQTTTGNNAIYQSVAVTPMGNPYFKDDSTGAFEETRQQRVNQGSVRTALHCPIGTAYTTSVSQAGGAGAA